MKKNTFFILAAFIIATALPVLAQQSTQQEKVICELAAKNCLNRAEILQKRLKKLDADIKKGSRTYSSEDLKNLEKKMQETQELLDKLEAPPAGK